MKTKSAPDLESANIVLVSGLIIKPHDAAHNTEIEQVARVSASDIYGW